MTRLFMHVPLTQLQGAIGKNGPTGIDLAKQHLTICFRRSATGVGADEAHSTQSLALEATEIIWLVGGTVDMQRCVPYSIIGVFISHVLLWAFCISAPECVKQSLGQSLTQNVRKGSEPLRSIILSAIDKDGGEGIDSGPRSVFKHAAQQLSGLGTWGASLNLALMLQRRSEL